MRFLPRLSFVVNSAPAPVEPIRVNAFTVVNSSQIRHEVHNGRDHIVIPSMTLPDDVVMNGGLYPHDEIEKSYLTLEGTYAPLGHPMVNGQFVPAGSPEALHTNHVGAWNRNVKRVGNRISIEKWLDVEFAMNTEGGRRLLDAIEKKEPIHTSTGLLVEREPAPAGKPYSWIARNMRFDHDAVLLGEVGAATPEQGVGLMVNVDQAQAQHMAANLGVLSDSFNMRRDKLEAAAREKWGGQDRWVYVVDFDSGRAIVSVEGEATAYTYEWKDGAAVFGEAIAPVEAKTEWVEKPTVRAMVNKLLQSLGLGVNSDASKTQTPSPEADQMDRKELNEALAEQARLIAANMDERLKPLTDRLQTLETNQAQVVDAINASARQAESDKRAAVVKHFKLTPEAAAGITGNALEEMFKQTQGAAPGIATNSEDMGGEDTYQLPK